jgi:hypothetical protein
MAKILRAKLAEAENKAASMAHARAELFYALHAMVHEPGSPSALAAAKKALAEHSYCSCGAHIPYWPGGPWMCESCMSA